MRTFFVCISLLVFNHLSHAIMNGENGFGLSGIANFPDLPQFVSVPTPTNPAPVSTPTPTPTITTTTTPSPPPPVTQSESQVQQPDMFSGMLNSFPGFNQFSGIFGGSTEPESPAPTVEDVDVSPSPSPSLLGEQSPPPLMSPPPPPPDCEAPADNQPNGQSSNFGGLSGLFQNGLGGTFSDMFGGLSQVDAPTPAGQGCAPQTEDGPTPAPEVEETGEVNEAGADRHTTGNPEATTLSKAQPSTILTRNDIRKLEQLVNSCRDARANRRESFIGRSGNRFSKDGFDFSFIGFNAYQTVSQVLRGQSSAVIELMENAQRLGMNVGRMWAFSDDIRTGPRSWSTETFEALDEVIKIAQDNGVHLVLGLTNYWQEYTSPELYIYWAYGSIEGRTVQDFYTDANVKLLFKAHMCQVTKRVNSITRKRYRDDPTIMGWNLINEPRCAGCNPSVIHSWISEMGSYLQNIDPNHLVTVGMEGFHTPTSSISGANPGVWALCQGVDFTDGHQQSGVDYVTAHVYPTHKGWDWENNRACDNDCQFNWAQYALQKQVERATSIGKPLVLEEFGVSVRLSYTNTGNGQSAYTISDRVDYYKRLLGALVSASNRGDSGSGGLFWTAATGGYADYDGYTVYIDDNSIVPYAASFPISAEENDRFRRKSFQDACVQEQQSLGWRPDIVAPQPVFTLSGSRPVDVIFNAAANI